MATRRQRPTRAQRGRPAPEHADRSRQGGGPGTSVRPAPPGTPLRDADLRAGKVSLEHWQPDLAYRWDSGVAISRFLDGLQQGRILGVRCHRCRRTVTPPRAFCEWCFKPMDEWVTLADTGTINTFSICYVTWDMQPLETPQIPAVIEIDGTDPRGGFLHLIGGIGARTVDGIRRRISHGQRVRAHWKPPGERVGAITDIMYFEPVDRT